MKKMTKLLSVILAFVMALSCMTMMASAAKAQYQTVANLKSLNAYSPYGTVTRLNVETRTSMLLDSLDQLLAPMTNLNMGYVVNVDLWFTKIQLYVNLTSVNEILKTLDSAASLLEGGWGTIAKGIVNLGILEDADLSGWNNNYKGMSREGNTQTEIVQAILNTLSDQGALIESVLTNGLNLGIVASFIKGLDLSSINGLVTDLPGTIKGLVFPLMSRQDDKQADRDKLNNKGNDLVAVAQEFVNGLFTKPMNWTSYRVNAAGENLGYTMDLPTEANGTSRYFVFNDDGSITQWDYKYAGLLGDPQAGYVETVTYTRAENEERKGSNTYTYVAPANYNGDATLKWYKADGKVDADGRIQSPYWLPSVKAAMDAGTLTLQINGADSVAGLLYKFIPYIFDEMAPVVLNGSVKKAIAEAFDVRFTKIGLKGDAAVTEEIKTMSADDKLFFTQAQEYYTWEYSDYKVIGGVPYYRYQDQYFKGEIPKNISEYYKMINWDYEIPKGFMNKYIPATLGATSEAGYTHILDALNTFVYDLINLFIKDSWDVNGVTKTRSTVFPWKTEKGNGDLLNNLMVCARNVFNLAPAEILDEYYKDAQFYEPMMNGTLNQAVNGLVCELVKLIMPQVKFPKAIVDQPITAIAAVVVRELCTQLMPTYNFDAMIYANYNGDASKEVRTLLTHTADEWLDITLYMGVNLGMYYLRNIADLGEGDSNGYYSVMSKLGALPSLTIDAENPTPAADEITFGANAYKAKDGQASWLVAIDWIIDWALADETKAMYAWHFEKLIDCGSEVNLATYQNPFNKLDTILLKLLPFDQLLNVSEFKETPDYKSGTFLEKVLKEGLVDSIVNLNLPSLLSLLKIPDGYFTQGNIVDSVVKIVVNLLNNVLNKVAGGNIVTGIDSVGTLLDQGKLRATVKTLVEKLGTAGQNGLLQPILPIANFFIGWTTDPQKYSEPQIYMSNSGNDTYLYSGNSNTLNILNSSSGMLLTHRNSTKEDKPYKIKITGIDFGDSGITTSGSYPEIGPGEKAEISLTVPNVAKTAKIVVSYEFKGKDGGALGGTQQKVYYAYISNIDDQENVNVDGTDKDGTISSNYKSYEFTEDIFGTITDYKVTVTKKTGIGQGSSRDPNGLYTNGAAVTEPASNYFEHRTDYADAGFVTVYKDESDGPMSSSGYLYKAKAGVTADTFSEENSIANNLYGLYDMGKISIKYRNSAKDYEVDFIYYNDFNIGATKDKYLGYALKAEDFTDAAAFTTYENALKEVIRLADFPKRTDYVETIQPQIKGAMTALENAYNALMKTAIVKEADIQTVKDALKEIETNPDRDLNYQDYKLFEYFQYEKQRTNARNMIKSVTPPAAPEKYIDGVWGTALVDKILEAQTNANVKTAVTATVVAPTKDDIENHTNAVKAFRGASYTDLQIEEQADMLRYYAKFMTDNPKTVDKTFLDQEIAYAEAQNYDATKYSADSWDRYTNALAAAKDASANSNQESKVFDAKYELMVAQNALLEKEKSMKEVGYMNEELIPLIQHANAILDNFGTVDALYKVKADAGLSDTEALTQLVRALGVRYDVIVGGKQHKGILYDYSAVTFEDYDRIATAKNKKAVDEAADKLRDAIEKFECTAKVESNDTVTAVDQEVRFIQGIAPNSLKSVDDLKAKLKVTSNATPAYTVSKAGQYGTGARVELRSADGSALYATYFVVIYGDVNGDGAVDAFDALEVDVATHTAYYMGDVYDDAADFNANGKVDSNDYSVIASAVKSGKAIDQNPTL